MAQPKALGVLETRGMAALLGAADAMLKAVEVRVCGRHGIGSGWVTLLVEGAVADVQTAIRIGSEEAVKRGDLITAEVIPRPDEGAMARMPHRAAVPETASGNQALGLLETRGLAPLIEGADAMVKTAAVDLTGWAFIGGALVHAVVRGDVAAVQTAVEAGRKAAENAGEVYATLDIPSPIEGIGALFPPPPAADPVSVGALGVLETTGYVSAVGGADGAVKAANVDLLGLSIGSGGRVAGLFSGPLDAVKAALDAGEEEARKAGELNGARLISRPDPGVMACFGGTAQGRQPRAQAMGLIETRSTVALVKAMDRMLKASEVEYEGSYKVGYFLTASVIRGDVGAVRVALEAGAEEAAKYGELVSAHLIPNPYAELEARLAHQ